MRDSQFDFRPLTEADIPMLYEWLCRPHVRQWWHGEPSAEEVREKYLPRIRAADGARPFIAMINAEPAGYIQYYLAGEGDPDWWPDWWPDKPGPGVLGIDQFLADGERLDQGLGAAMISRFVERLLKDPSVTEIRVDPHPKNMRAIRCYEKVGFESIGPFDSPDGPAVMMILRRPDLRDL